MLTGSHPSVKLRLAPQRSEAAKVEIDGPEGLIRGMGAASNDVDVGLSVGRNEVLGLPDHPDRCGRERQRGARGEQREQDRKRAGRESSRSHATWLMGKSLNDDRASRLRPWSQRYRDEAASVSRQNVPFSTGRAADTR